MKKALEVTKELGGENYVFWGGREGYPNLYNTDLKRELDHLAKFFHLAVDYKKKIGFTGQFLIEPKPKEPTDAPVRLRRRRVHRLPARPTAWTKHFKLNIETNHATLAGHTMMHELTYAVAATACSARIDANRGDLLLGWDTDQFPTDLYLTTQMHAGDPRPGRPRLRAALNFDAKVRRESFEPVDLFHAHIGGMDAFAHGLKIAAADPQGRRAQGLRQAALRLVGHRHRRRRSRAARRSFEDLEKYMLEKGDADDERVRPAGDAGEHHQSVSEVSQ